MNTPDMCRRLSGAVTRRRRTLSAAVLSLAAAGLLASCGTDRQADTSPSSVQNSVDVETADDQAAAKVDEQAATEARKKRAEERRAARRSASRRRARVEARKRTERRRRARAAALAAATPTPEATPASDSCDSSYEGACLDSGSSDYDCEGGSGDGPDYTGTVQVVGDDHFDLDRDGDGIACDT